MLERDVTKVRCGVVQRYKKIVKKKQIDKNDLKSYAPYELGKFFPIWHRPLAVGHCGVVSWANAGLCRGRLRAVVMGGLHGLVSGSM